MSGYVKTYRAAMDHAVFDDEWLWKLFSWCVMRANYKDSYTADGLVKRGSFTIGRIAASRELRCSDSRVYRGLQKLQSLGSISLISNSRFTTITVCNYDSYQGEDDATRTADEQPMNSKRTAGDTTNEQPANTRRRREEGKKGRSIKAKPKNETPMPEVPFQLAGIWDRWLSYKGQRNESYVEEGLRTGISRLINRSAEFGFTAVSEAIEDAMANNYHGWDFKNHWSELRKNRGKAAEPHGNEPITKKFTPVDITK